MECKACERNVVEGEEFCIWHIRREGKVFEGINIEYERVKGAYLVKAKFKDVVLNNCDFTDSDFQGAEFSNTKIMNCNFITEKGLMDLSKAKFLDKTIVENCRFSEVDISYSEISSSKFVGCTVIKSDLSSSRITDSTLKDCEFSDSDFSGSVMKNVGLVNSSFSEADLSKSIFRDSEVVDCDFSDADLSSSYFIKTNVQSSYFRETNLSKAVLREIKVIDCDFTRADVTRADLSGSNLENSKFFASDLRGTDLTDALLFNVAFQHSTLKSAILDEVVREERDAEKAKSQGERMKLFGRASAVYRELKDYFHREGLYELASHYRHRERVCDRKRRKWTDISKYVSFVLDMLYGYGEKPFRLLLWWIAVILGFAVGYSSLGLFAPSYVEIIYFSLKTFFGLPVSEEHVSQAIRVLEMVESAMGKVLLALFIAISSKKVD